MSSEFADDDDDDDEYEYEEHFSDDGEDDEDVGTPTRPSRTPGLKELKVPDGNYIITCFSEILPYRDSLISEVSSLLDVDRDQAHLLLQHYRWEKEKLIDKFFSGSSEEVLLDVGLDLYTPAVAAAIKDGNVRDSLESERKVMDTESKTEGESSGRFASDCRICYDPDDHAPRSVLGCGHSFHNGCYRDYLINELSIGPACILAHCPEVKCRQRIPRSLFEKLLSRDDMERYELYVARSFIETSKTLRYCPSPGCDKVAIGSGIATVKCSCSYPFCFRCGEEAHEPVTCAQLATWTLKCQNESETANWILVNTKKCPQCQTRIEKNQGCNHMTCTKCKHDFCWICNAPWSEHGSDTGGFYKCNKYDPAKPDSSGKYPLDASILDMFIRLINCCFLHSFSQPPRPRKPSRSWTATYTIINATTATTLHSSLPTEPARKQRSAWGTTKRRSRPHGSTSSSSRQPTNRSSSAAESSSTRMSWDSFWRTTAARSNCSNTSKRCLRRTPRSFTGSSRAITLTAPPTASASHLPNLSYLIKLNHQVHRDEWCRVC